jgi:hypothetical protein
MAAAELQKDHCVGILHFQSIGGLHATDVGLLERVVKSDPSHSDPYEALRNGYTELLGLGLEG